MNLVEVAVHDAAEKAFKALFAADVAAGKFQINVRPSVATRIGEKRSIGDIRAAHTTEIPTPAFVYSIVGGYWPEVLDSPYELQRTVQIDSISRRVRSATAVGGYQETVLMDRELLKQLRKTKRLVSIEDLVDEYEDDLAIYRRVRLVVMTGDP